MVLLSRVNKQPAVRQKKKRSPIFTAVIIVATMFILYLIYAVAVPFLIGDGLGNYKGIQKEVAEKSIDYSSRYLDNKTRFAFRYHVDAMKATSPDEIEKYCRPFGGQITSDPNDTRYYTVTMTVRELFNPFAKTVTVDGCTAFGSYADGPYKSR